MDLQFASWGTRPLTNIIHFTDVVFRNVALHLSTLASRTSTWDVHRFRLNIFHILVNLRKQNYDPGYVFVALLYMKRSATDHAPLHLTSSEAERYFLGALLDAIHQVKPVRLPEPALWIYSTSYLKALRQQWCTKMHRRHYSVHPVLLKTFCDTILRHPEHTVIHGDIYPIFTDAEMLDELMVPKGIYQELQAEELKLTRGHKRAPQAQRTLSTSISLPPFLEPSSPRKTRSRRAVKFNVVTKGDSEAPTFYQSFSSLHKEDGQRTLSDAIFEAIPALSHLQGRPAPIPIMKSSDQTMSFV